MHHTRTTLATAISILALSLAGCTNASSDGTPPEQTNTTPSSDPNTEPEIANPKDLAAVTDPCQLLKPGQAQQLGTGNPLPGEQSFWGQSSCIWETGELEFSLKPDTVQGNGISSAMENESKTQPDGEVNGYPFVETSSTESSCALYVGPSEKQVFIISVTTDLDPATPPCELAKQASGFVLSNLPPMS